MRDNTLHTRNFLIRLQHLLPNQSTGANARVHTRTPRLLDEFPNSPTSHRPKQMAACAT
jgi:hypothetical protein